MKRHREAMVDIADPENRTLLREELLVGSGGMNRLSLSNLPPSPYLLLDPAGDGEPARFYRAFMR
jgi:hypothetical protein